MTPALYVLSLVDDFGEFVQVCYWEKDLYMFRYNYFNGRF